VHDLSSLAADVKREKTLRAWPLLYMLVARKEADLYMTKTSHWQVAARHKFGGPLHTGRAKSHMLHHHQLHPVGRPTPTARWWPAI
jgi:hypothetical protein